MEVSSSGGNRRKKEWERPEQQLYKTDEEKGWHREYRDLLEGVEGQAIALIYALRLFIQKQFITCFLQTLQSIYTALAAPLLQPKGQSRDS